MHNKCKAFRHFHDSPVRIQRQRCHQIPNTQLVTVALRSETTQLHVAQR
jgi:hypothetical protein